MVATKLITVEALEAMGGGGRHSELVDGVLLEMSPTAWDHGFIASDLHEFLAPYVRSRRLGQLLIAGAGFAVAREPDSVLAPDIAFVSTERLDDVKRGRGFSPVAPDLVVEIESTSNSERQIARKMELYLAGGTRLIWLIRPRTRAVLVYRPDRPVETLTAADELDGHDVLPGFRLKIGELFKSLA